MPAQHSLALPLSAAYAHDYRDGYSFFHATTSTDLTDATDESLLLHPTLSRYLDDLCGFLRNARLIQAHPDNYFQFMLGQTWAASAVHFDGSPVELHELQQTQRLLSSFESLLQGEDVMEKLRTLVRDGPLSATCPRDAGGHSCAEPLVDFYAMTRRLMLGRAQRPENDAATVTLLSPAACSAMDRSSASALAARAHKRRILDLVLSRGMNPKKQHEVRIMRDTMQDLVECCNADMTTPAQPSHQQPMRDENGDGAAEAPTEVQQRPQAAPPLASPLCAPYAAASVETVINIGEGKGYVSRALALCDNLQVVGLDCNPAHKERAVERIESLLETSLSSRDGRSRVNLLYEPRGHVASIACRVEENVDWRQLLQGHVRTCEDPVCACGRASLGSSSADTVAVVGDSASVWEQPDGAVGDSGVSRLECSDDAGSTLSRTRGEESIKLACRVCGKVVRLESTTVIMKHIYTHLNSNNNAKTWTATAASAPWIPSAEQLHTWNLSLSQHAYVAKLRETFFTVTDVEQRHHENRKDAALLKRAREGCVREDACGEGDELTETGTAEAANRHYLTLPHVSAAPQSLVCAAGAADGKSVSRERSVTLQPTYTARGYRVVLLIARPVSAAATVATTRESSETPPLPPTETSASQDASEGDEHTERSTLSKDGDLPSEPLVDQRWMYVQHVATIVGYDGGADSHQVCLDGESKKRVLRLYRVPPTSTSPSPTGASASPSVQFHLESNPTSSCAAPLACVGEWQLPDPVVWGRERVALILSVFPPAVPSTPVVYVPTVRNTVLIGLHPCGDLGSNVCRIFRNSAARGLLLVSCCWHALTPQGFPLSRALQRRGMTVNSVSLLLATQPLDAWSTASPEGHRSSARLLFYRSLFKLLWAQLVREWTEERQRSGTTVSDDTHGACEFPVAPPHLEPAFLRRMSRQKESLTFCEFMSAIAANYLYQETAKDTPYTPWNIGHRCSSCRAAQEAFVRRALTERSVAEQMAKRFEKDHFAQFLGLTVLRMWMCHLVESLLLLDRALYLHEELSFGSSGVTKEEDSAVSLVPLFDGALSPRMYGILARRGGVA
jgi:hypothetical protein